MSLFSGHSPRIRILTDSAVPSQFCWTTVPSPCIEKRDERATRRARKRIFEDCQAEQLFQENEHCEEIVFLQSDKMELNTGNYEEVDGNIPDESINEDKSVQASVECTSKITQTDDCAVQVKVVVQATSVDAFIDDPEGMHFFTGLHFQHRQTWNIQVEHNIPEAFTIFIIWYVVNVWWRWVQVDHTLETATGAKIHVLHLNRSQCVWKHGGMFAISGCRFPNTGFRLWL